MQMRKLQIILIYVLASTCQRSPSAKGEDQPLSACYAIPGQDGFDDLICDGKPIKQRPGPKGEKGDKGVNGSPGAQGIQGLPGPAGGARAIDRNCHYSWIEHSETYDITYLIFKNADGSRDALVRIIQTGLDEGIFSNSSIYLAQDPLFESSPVNVEGFEVKLVNAGQAYVRFRPTRREETFSCK